MNIVEDRWSMNHKATLLNQESYSPPTHHFKLDPPTLAGINILHSGDFNHLLLQLLLLFLLFFSVYTSNTTNNKIMFFHYFNLASSFTCTACTLIIMMKRIIIIHNMKNNRNRCEMKIEVVKNYNNVSCCS